jgi:hypothetical protein
MDENYGARRGNRVRLILATVAVAVACIVSIGLDKEVVALITGVLALIGAGALLSTARGRG